MRWLSPLGTIAGSLLLAGCGGATSGQVPAQTSTSAPAASTTTTTTSSSRSATGPGALQAEAKSAATGDIPDNQVFLVYRNPSSRYSIKYPEGWAQQGSGSRVVFRDKNNVVRIVVGSGSATISQARADMRRLGHAHVTQPPTSVTLGGVRAVKVVYTTESAPNPVTGKRVTLVVDRYYLGRSGRRAIVDLGTPQGVDNVDAYRLMIESFRWR